MSILRCYPARQRSASGGFHMPSKNGCVKTQSWCIVSLLAFLHRVRRLASEIGAIRRISHHNFRKLKMWPVTTLLVIGAVTRAISQAPLFHAHSGYEADHYHRHSQMPENTEGIFYRNNNPPQQKYLIGRQLYQGGSGVNRHGWVRCQSAVTPGSVMPKP